MYGDMKEGLEMGRTQMKKMEMIFEKVERKWRDVYERRCVMNEKDEVMNAYL